MKNNQFNQDEERYIASDLIVFATTLLERDGLAHDRARIVAEILVEADLMGHTTHGLQLLPWYLKALETGAMAAEGEPEIVADTGAAITWDGHYLPGPWLVIKAMELAFDRIQTHPVVTVVIRRSHHIACLAAYPKQATDRGLFMLLTCSAPNFKAVAPYGGLQPVYAPDPLAAGIPTQGDPIILDISMSSTAHGVVQRSHQEGRRLPYQWLSDPQGNPSDDPAVMFSDPSGSILPLGGTDLGYKGFALGLIVEALTSALSGYGRSDQPKHSTTSVFLQLIDPEAFGGREYFRRETEWLAEACRQNPVKSGNPPVRLPGSRALQLRAEQLQKGVTLYPTIMPALKHWAEKFGVPVPNPKKPF
jgi:LDH2 family malate/lactate/ureidoglycolate dehydrogenase